MSRAAAERQRTDPKTCVKVLRWFQPDSMTERWKAAPLVAEPVADIRWLDLDAFADVEIVAHREVLRQQFSFSPNGATQEVGEYALPLERVSVIQLRIVPSIDGQPVVARVTEFRVASD